MRTFEKKFSGGHYTALDSALPPGSGPARPARPARMSSPGMPLSEASAFVIRAPDLMGPGGALSAAHGGRRLWAIVIVAGLLVLAALVGVVIWLAVQSERRRTEAEADARDARKERDLVKPEDAKTAGTRVPVNVPTRGEPTEYTLVGRLSVVDGTGATNQNKVQKNNVLELWGRPTYVRSYRWNYYLKMENGLRLPLELSGRNCEAEIGCPEIDDGDFVVVRELDNTKYVYNRYLEQSLRYIP